MLSMESWKALLSEYSPLLFILVGIVLVSVTIGPFKNGDTQLEFEAASGVIRWGCPTRNMLEILLTSHRWAFTLRLFFQFFGLAFKIGVALVTLFGLGSTILVYKIGENRYGKRTGLFAAVLFALTPCQFAFSRSFLIDVQCLFFSLSFLFVGIRAIRKDSFKLFIFSGILFAMALLTKFYAVFTLIPLTLLSTKEFKTFTCCGCIFFTRNTSHFFVVLRNLELWTAQCF
jgi:4-amino-4-deoxy-L-arabinose transferase-like glycosyltransferase